MDIVTRFYALLGSIFGYSAEYGDTFHTGQDYPWGLGTAIPSFGPGRVVAKGYNGIHGHWVSIIIGSTYFHFCHMREASPLAVGDKVERGTIVGYVGATGDVTGPHLHLAASNQPTPGQGNRVNPVPLIAAYLTTLAGLGGATPIGEDTMFALRNGDGSGSIGLVGPDGTLDPLTGPEWESLKRVGLLAGDGYFQESDGYVWNTLAARTARVRAVQSGDPAAIAQTVAQLVVPAVIASLVGKTGITKADVEEAAEAAIREVFADAAK